ILMLTAKSEEVDKILGLEVGADDYITKPFSPREVVARVNAILRRVKIYEELESTISEDIIIGNIKITPKNYEVFLKGNKLELTPKQFELLLYFGRNKDNVLT